MKRISQELISFLSSVSEFTDMMSDQVFFIMALEGTNFPFTTFKINDQVPSTIDCDLYTVQINFWFGQNKSLECADFVDMMKSVFENTENYDWQGSTVDFIEDAYSFVGIINLNVN